MDSDRHMGHFDKVLGKEPKSPNPEDAFKRVDELVRHTEKLLAQGEAIVGQLNSLTPEDAEWVDWFGGLSEDHKRLVEMCAEKGVVVTPDNIDALLNFLEEKCKRETLEVRADMSGPGAAADCLDCLVAFPVAIAKMREDQDVSSIPESMVSHTKDAFARFDQTSDNPTQLAFSAADKIYQNLAQLKIRDIFTDAYVSIVVREYFRQLSLREQTVFYILDNAIREDRFQLLCELFPPAGIVVVTPPLHGGDWRQLKMLIESTVYNHRHVAYIEPDATVNHIESAIRLAKELKCVSTFRCLDPEESKFEILNTGQ